MRKITICPPGYAHGYAQGETYGDHLNETIQDDGRISADPKDHFIAVKKHGKTRIVNTYMTAQKIINNILKK